MSTIDEQKKILKAFQKSFRSRSQTTVGKTQAFFPSSAPVKGPVWIAQDDIHVAAETAVRNAVFEAIQFAKTEHIVLPPRSEIDARDVHIEWVGQRRGAGANACQPAEMPDDSIFEKLQADVEHDVTVIFAHGGAFYGGTHVTARPASTKLARLTKGRVVSIDYRLSPQSQFPGALLDLLLVYLALQHPPPRSRHLPVPHNKIVIAGESSGGGLCLSLIQLILQMRHLQKTDTPKVRFNNQEVVVPMPAGVSVLGAEVDRTISLPSTGNNADVDFLLPQATANTPLQEPDDIWPSKTPRHDVYCHSSAYLHPVSNPCTATDWAGSPPMWLAYGEERVIDGGKMLASTAATQGVPVQFKEYLGMPHIFPMIFSKFPQSVMCFAEWAHVCRHMAEGRPMASRASVVSSVKTPADVMQDTDIAKLLSLSREEAMAIIRRAKETRPLYTGKGRSKAAL